MKTYWTFHATWRSWFLKSGVMHRTCPSMNSDVWLRSVKGGSDLETQDTQREVWKSAVHRSTVRSNASSKFLQNYAGRRVRQPRTPNTSAERRFTNLIKLKQYRVKKTVSPSTPTCWRRTPSFRSRRNTISHRKTKTQQANKQRTKRQNKQDNVFPLSVCLMSS